MVHIRALLALTAVAFVLPASAHATTVTSTESCSSEFGVCQVSIAVTAAPGETNDITLAASGVTPIGTGYRISDAGAPITAVQGCTRIDEHAVLCGIPDGGVTAAIDAGDGDDRIVAADSTSVTPGPGSDTVTAREVSYFDHGTPVTVDLAAGTGGSDGEHDVLNGVVSVSGSEQADTLLGNDAANSLDGYGGGDVIDGRGGDDDLGGGAGRDRLVGSAGNDSIDAADPRRSREPRGDSVSCGDGADDVGAGIESPTDILDVVAADCELAEWPDFTVSAQPTIARGKLAVRVSAPACRCRGTLTLRSGGKTIGSGKIPAKSRRLTAKLNRTGRRLLAKPGSHRIQLVWVSGRSRGGHTVTVGAAASRR